MTSDTSNTGGDRQERSKPAQAEPLANFDAQDRPEWAGGLQKLYNSVVDEPLPDSFKDLLAQLDADK